MTAAQMEVMPRPDPVPSRSQSPNRSTLRQFMLIFKWLVLLSIVIAGIAVILVARGDTSLHIHMLIATALGVCFTVLLGTSLMALSFLSSSSGHDEEAHFRKDDR